MAETKIEINITTIEDINIVVVEGDIDANTAASLTTEVTKVLNLVESKGKILLDMTGVEYMSSAGLRTLLSIHRQNIVLVGLNEELTDTMDTTGFLQYFVTTQDRKAGLEALNKE